MIIRSEELKDICSKILTAVDSSELSAVTETLQLDFTKITSNKGDVAGELSVHAD